MRCHRAARLVGYANGIGARRKPGERRHAIEVIIVPIHHQPGSGVGDVEYDRAVRRPNAGRRFGHSHEAERTHRPLHREGTNAHAAGAVKNIQVVISLRQVGDGERCVGRHEAGVFRSGEGHVPHRHPVEVQHYAAVAAGGYRVGYRTRRSQGAVRFGHHSGTFVIAAVCVRNREDVGACGKALKGVAYGDGARGSGRQGVSPGVGRGVGQAERPGSSVNAVADLAVVEHGEGFVHRSAVEKQLGRSHEGEGRIPGTIPRVGDDERVGTRAEVGQDSIGASVHSGAGPYNLREEVSVVQDVDQAVVRTSALRRADVQYGELQVGTVYGVYGQEEGALAVEAVCFDEYELIVSRFQISGWYHYAFVAERAKGRHTRWPDVGEVEVGDTSQDGYDCVAVGIQGHGEVDLAGRFFHRDRTHFRTATFVVRYGKGVRPRPQPGDGIGAIRCVGDGAPDRAGPADGIVSRTTRDGNLRHPVGTAYGGGRCGGGGAVDDQRGEGYDIPPPAGDTAIKVSDFHGVGSCRQAGEVLAGAHEPVGAGPGEGRPRAVARYAIKVRSGETGKRDGTISGTPYALHRYAETGVVVVGARRLKTELALRETADDISVSVAVG